MIVEVQPKKAIEINKLTIFQNNKKNSSKIITTIFLFLHFVFFLDFGFLEIKSFKLKVFWKIINISLCTAIGMEIIVSMFMNMNQMATPWYAVFITQYILEVALITFSNSSLSNLVKHLHMIDNEMGVDSRSHYLEYKLISGILVLMGIKLIYTYVYCTFFNDFCIKPLLQQALYLITLLGLDLVLVINFVAFYFVYCRLKKFTAFIEKCDYKITLCKHIYKSLIDSTETIKKDFDGVFTLSMIFQVPIVMTIIYIALCNLKSSEHLKFSLEELCACYTLLLQFLPAYAADWMWSEVDKIKMLLYDKLLFANDDQEQELLKFINYIDARPFKFSAYKIMPLDYTLPIIIINIWVTYIIVIVQFTHLY